VTVQGVVTTATLRIRNQSGVLFNSAAAINTLLRHIHLDSKKRFTILVGITIWQGARIGKYRRRKVSGWSGAVRQKIL
jgi:hypothetical protein